MKEEEIKAIIEDIVFSEEPKNGIYGQSIAAKAIIELHDKEMIEFAEWMLKQSKEHGFYELGEGKYRYNYRSPYTMKELLDLYKQQKL